MVVGQIVIILIIEQLGSQHIELQQNVCQSSVDLSIIHVNCF